MKQVNERFAAHVTSTAFHLSLSRSMIVSLVAIANQKTPGQYGNALRVAGLRDTAVDTNRRLEDRGLIVAPDPKYPGLYEITSAGKLVVELLKEAGLVQDVPSEVAA